MSKGPGKIERAVVELVASDPENAFTVKEACRRIYHVYPVEKKHVVSVIRAAKSAIKRGTNIGLMGEGGRGHEVVIYTPDNLMSHGVAHFKCDDWVWGDERARERLMADDYRGHMSPGGYLWDEVELFKAKRDGDSERVAKIEASIVRRRLAAEAAFKRQFG